MVPVVATANADTIGGLLECAGSVVTWLITQMGAYLDFIIARPIILVPCLIMLAGLGLGMLGRAAHTI